MGGGLSVSDVALAAAFGTAVLLGNRPYSAPLRALLWLNLVYQFATLFTVIVNPYVANTVEWFHAWLLISGALIVGWALGRADTRRRLAPADLRRPRVIAVGTIVTGLLQYAAGDFGAVYPLWPLPMHKNAAGTLMAFAALIVYRPTRLGALARRLDARSPSGCCCVAIVMTQSRQALIGLIVAIVVIVVARAARRTLALAALLVDPRDLARRHDGDRADRIAESVQLVLPALDWITRGLRACGSTSPVFGHGLRYWYTDTASAFQPPQAELEVLASAGIVGLVGFIVMWIGVRRGALAGGPALRHARARGRR